MSLEFSYTTKIMVLGTNFGQFGDISKRMNVAGDNKLAKVSLESMLMTLKALKYIVTTF